MTTEIIKKKIEILKRYNHYIKEWLANGESTMSDEDLHTVYDANQRELHHLTKELNRRKAADA